MGSHAITYAVVALALALACLAAGFFWGRSNVKAQIEDAVEKEHVALDAREFAMRTQLEDTIVENARLRPLAEELARVQKRLEQEQGKYARMRADFNATFGSDASGIAEPDELTPPPAPSADEAIQKLLQSLEVFNAPDAPTPVPPDAAKPVAPATVSAPPVPAPNPPAPAPTPAVSPVPKPLAIPEFRPAPKPSRPVPASPASIPATTTVPAAPPAAAKSPARSNPIPAAAPANPAPPPTRPAAPPAKSGQNVDEWQEFARQLEALTGKKK